jgi:hypothetical protein
MPIDGSSVLTALLETLRLPERSPRIDTAESGEWRTPGKAAHPDASSVLIELEIPMVASLATDPSLARNATAMTGLQLPVLLRLTLKITRRCPQIPRFRGTTLRHNLVPVPKFESSRTFFRR